MSSREYQICSVVASDLAKIVVESAQNAIKTSGRFVLGLSGGSVIDLLTTALTTLEIDFSKWTLIFCDERLVDPDSPDSTFGLYRKKLIPHVALKEDQFLQVNSKLTVSEAAQDYERRLREMYPSPCVCPKIDLVLLGMGEDGHTCSLFPGHPLTRIDDPTCWVTPIMDSPKPPPERITLTFPVLNNAVKAVFPIVGAGKAKLVRAILKNEPEASNYPAASVKGNVLWLLDEKAASLL